MQGLLRQNMLSIVRHSCWTGYRQQLEQINPTALFTMHYSQAAMFCRQPISRRHHSSAASAHPVDTVDWSGLDTDATAGFVTDLYSPQQRRQSRPGRQGTSNRATSEPPHAARRIDWPTQPEDDPTGNFLASMFGPPLRCTVRRVKNGAPFLQLQLRAAEVAETAVAALAAAVSGDTSPGSNMLLQMPQACTAAASSAAPEACAAAMPQCAADAKGLSAIRETPPSSGDSSDILPQALPAAAGPSGTSSSLHAAPQLAVTVPQESTD